MQLIWNQHDKYNPVLIWVGALFAFGGGYALYIMGIKGPLIAWLIRAIFAIALALGLITLARQFELWKRLRAEKQRNPQVILGGR